MNKFLTLQSVDDILQKIQGFSPLEVEELPLESCLGRVLAESFLSPEDLPGFDRSTMDGFAVRAKDVFGASEGNPALLDYVGECRMGEAVALHIGIGQTARIWTGGMLPEGADAVVMLEYSREVGSTQIELTRPAAPLDNVISRDEDASRGQELVAAGTILRSQELGIFAGLGIERAKVRRKPLIGVISSGDEIVPLTAEPKPGQVRDINSTTLVALAKSLGAEGKFFGLAGDDRHELDRLVKQALTECDVVLLSGGSSAGQRDFTVHVLEHTPGTKILAHGVAISPGKPLIMARCGAKSLWGLPGHVASALVCAEVFIRPLVHRLLGVRDNQDGCGRRLYARMTRPVSSSQGRRDYIRVALEERPNAMQGDFLPWARPIMGKSGLISTLVEAHGLAICREDMEGLEAGQVVEVQLLT